MGMKIDTPQMWAHLLLFALWFIHTQAVTVVVSTGTSYLLYNQLQPETCITHQWAQCCYNDGGIFAQGQCLHPATAVLGDTATRDVTISVISPSATVAGQNHVAIYTRPHSNNAQHCYATGGIYYRATCYHHSQIVTLRQGVICSNEKYCCHIIDGHGLHACLPHQYNPLTSENLGAAVSCAAFAAVPC